MNISDAYFPSSVNPNHYGLDDEDFVNVVGRACAFIVSAYHQLHKVGDKTDNIENYDTQPRKNAVDRMT